MHKRLEEEFDTLQDLLQHGTRLLAPIIEWPEQDAYPKERKRIFDIAFDHCDCGSKILCKNEHGIIQPCTRTVSYGDLEEKDTESPRYRKRLKTLQENASELQRILQVASLTCVMLRKMKMLKK
jgi:hypothetical protein